MSKTCNIIEDLEFHTKFFPEKIKIYDCNVDIKLNGLKQT